MGVLGSGVAWIQSGRSDGTPTPYELALQPNGGDISIGWNSISGGTLSANWNEPGKNSYNALSWGRAQNALTNAPANFDNANGYIMFNYHGGTGAAYGRQFGFIDTDGGVYTRMVQNGTWASWRRFGLYSSSGHFEIDGGATWTTSGWQKNLWCTVSHGAIQMSTGDGSYGIGASSGLFYLWRAGGDLAGSSLAYLIAANLTRFEIYSNYLKAYSVEVHTGYGLYLDGTTHNVFFATNDGTYGGTRMGGSKGGYAGLRIADALGAPTLMFTTGSYQGGIYAEGVGEWWLLMDSNRKWYQTGAQYLTPMVTWATFSSGLSATMSRGTAAPSGGTNGDIYYQYT
jgi:hypothetical protein